jgi:predicted alpha-1,6-mannanase (GH76 family)
MKRLLKYTLLCALAAATLQSCQDIDDKYTYGEGLYTIDWNAAADSATNTLISRFWNTSTHYFVYNADEFDNGQDPGYWPQAHAMDVIIDAYLRTGDAKYSALFDQWYEGIKAVNFSNRGTGYRNNYYDDSEWMALTMLRLYGVTNDEKYLSTAKDLWEWIKSGWSDLGGGGIAWERTTHGNLKNACSNGPAALLGARLYNITKDQSDLDWALKIYDWEKATLFNPATGAVYDGYNATTETIDDVTLSYNSGTFLGAAHELYKITGDETYLNDARKAAYYAITNSSMIDTGNNVLRDEGKGDGGLFKGIFMRYFVQLILEPNLNTVYANKFQTFFCNNAEVLWRKGVNKNDLLFGTNWATATVGTTQLTSHTSGCTMMEARAYYEKNKK